MFMVGEDIPAVNEAVPGRLPFVFRLVVQRKGNVVNVFGSRRFKVSTLGH